MTATGQELADLVQQQQTAEAADLEEQTTAEAEAGAGDELAALVTVALAGWVAAFGALTVAGTGAALGRYLAGVRRDVDRATSGLDGRAPRVVRARLGEAAELGARHAVAFAGRAAGGRPRMPRVAVPEDVLDAVRALGGTVREQLRLSARLLSEQEVQRSGWRGVLAGIGAARRAVGLVGRVASWALHRAINAGAAQAIEALGARSLWVAEPTACVRCQAYAGQIADAGGRFPGGLSLDPAQRAVGAAPIDGPPIHPHDRCRLVPWRDEWAPHTGPALPDLLREQAWQSVAAGRARPSESRTARLRAARTLLTQRGVPARVRRQAQAAVAAGHF
ncbi:MAG TPA: hypothetical protein VIP28_10500 [Nocardioides sp.]